MLPFVYAEEPLSYNTAEVFCVRIDPGIRVAEELIRSLYYLLWFPGYFGFNWDALFDCLRDFDWIPCRKIILMHESVPQLPENDLRIYLEILRDAVLEWHEGEAHELEVVFHLSDKDMIEMLVK